MAFGCAEIADADENSRGEAGIRPIARYFTTKTGTLRSYWKNTSPFLKLRRVWSFLVTLVTSVGAVHGQLYWNTNGTSGNWTDSNWGASSSGPFSTGYTNGNNVFFTANSSLVSRTASAGNITVSSNVVVGFTNGSGSFGTGGNVRKLDIGIGGVLDFANTGWSTSAGTGFIKEGQGILKLSGDANWQGGFTLNNGTIIVGGVNAMGGGSSNLLTINSGTIAANANRDLTGKYGGGIAFGGNFQIGAVTTGVASGNGTASANMTFSNNVALGSSTRTITIGANGTYAFNGIISANGSSGLTINATSGSTGTIVLGGANTFNGTATLNGGTLALANVNAVQNSVLDTGAVGSQAVTFTLSGTNTYNLGGLAGSDALSIGANSISVGANNASTTYSGVLQSSGGGLTKVGTGTLALNGTNTYTGATSINTGILQLGNGGTSGALSTSSAITVNGTLAFNRSNDVVQGTDFSSSTIISGTGALVQMGAGNLTLNTANTYSGGTTLNSGTLVLNNASAIGSGALTINGGEINSTTGGITLENNTQNWNGDFAFSGTTDLNIGAGAISMNASRILTINAGTLAVGGSISGPGSLTKNGSGTLVLSGSNSYTSCTVINAGTLNATSAKALGSNNTIQVNSGTLLVSADDAINGREITLNGTSATVATLSFNGDYNGTIQKLTLSANSIIDLGPANSVALEFADLAMGFYNAYNTLSIYNWSGMTRWGGVSGNDSDKIYIRGGSYDLNKLRFYSGNVGENDSFIGTGFDLGLESTGFSPGFISHHIIPVPEPETWATGILLLIAGAWRMRLKCYQESGNLKSELAKKS